MDTTVKTEYLEDIKKLIAQDCSVKCFVKNTEGCLDKCYDSYLTALNITAKTLRDIGYMRNSRYITLVYGEKYDEWDRITKFNDNSPDELGYPVPYLEKNIFDPSRDI